MRFHTAHRSVCGALAALLSLAPAAAAQSSDAPAARPALAEPAISPDRSEIAFVSGGDIWTVAAAGGEARLLVSHPASESRPVYAPDGRRIAFTSARTGNGDVYVLDLAGGELTRVTHDDGLDLVDGWSRDGRWLYFTSSSRDIGGMNDVYRVPAGGGTPALVAGDRYVNEYFSAESPDGSALAITARGLGSGQWWRLGSSHIDESEVWLVRGASPPAYERLTEGGARESWPMWGPGGRVVYYVSDRGGAQNVWAKPTGAGAARRVTSFTGGRVLWPSISADGRTVVFERDFHIWSLDTEGGRARELPITLRGAPAGAAVEHLTLTNGFQELALSPDGKKVAVVARGEVFAAASKDAGPAARVTTTPGAESQVVWSPDSRRLIYVSDREGVPRLFAYDFATGAETRLTSSPEDDMEPRFSPDGKQLAFIRNARELRALDLGSREERVLAAAVFERPPLNADRQFVWSPDGRWIAFMPNGEKLFKNASVVPSAGGDARPASFLANVGSNTISWSPDGTFLLFDTSQRTESGQLARVDLVPRAPRFREDQFRDLFREETAPAVAPAQRNQPPDVKPQDPVSPSPAAVPSQEPGTAQPGVPRPPASQPEEPSKKPAAITFEGIRRRLTMVPVGVDVSYQAISPDGKWVVLVAAAAGQQHLYVYSLDELAKEPPVARQITSSPAPKAYPQFSPDSKEVYYLENGAIQAVAIESRQPRPVAVSAELDVSFPLERQEVFRQAWTWLRDWFYDPSFHGLDWQGVRARYAPYVAGSRTPDELRRVLSLMIGELNASHLGIGGAGGATETTGRLGLRFDRAEYERTGALRVTEVVPLGPADLSRGVSPGDYVLAVDGVPLTPSTNLDALLAYKVGRRVALRVSPSRDGSGSREVALQPVNRTTERGLVYRAWVESRRDYVSRVSRGRLGYVHMYDMSSAALAQLFVDLDAENHGREGVIIDIRNNNGGFVNAYALDVFARRPYLTMTYRGFPPAPARTVLGQRALERPTALVINQHSLSDAEDFAEGYRALGLGPIVGEPTAGWIIYTSNVQLVDGSTLRLPFIEIRGSKGEVLERNPRQPDVTVVRPVGEGYSDKDSQLDAAVRALLERVQAR